MKSTALMIAGPIISALGIYFRYRKKSVGEWMKTRRIDQVEKIVVSTCPECGASMKRRKYRSGHREGAAPLVCENWPECRSVKWGC